MLYKFHFQYCKLTGHPNYSGHILFSQTLSRIYKSDHMMEINAVVHTQETFVKPYPLFKNVFC